MVTLNEKEMEIMKKAIRRITTQTHISISELNNYLKDGKMPDSVYQTLKNIYNVDKVEDIPNSTANMTLYKVSKIYEAIQVAKEEENKPKQVFLSNKEQNSIKKTISDLTKYITQLEILRIEIDQKSKGATGVERQNYITQKSMLTRSIKAATKAKGILLHSFNGSVAEDLYNWLFTPTAKKGSKMEQITDALYQFESAQDKSALPTGNGAHKLVKEFNRMNERGFTSPSPLSGNDGSDGNNDGGNDSGKKPIINPGAGSNNTDDDNGDGDNNGSVEGGDTGNNDTGSGNNGGDTNNGGTNDGTGTGDNTGDGTGDSGSTDNGGASNGTDGNNGEDGGSEFDLPDGTNDDTEIEIPDSPSAGDTPNAGNKPTTTAADIMKSYRAQSNDVEERKYRTVNLGFGRRLLGFIGRHWLSLGVLAGATALAVTAILGPGAGVAVMIGRAALYNILSLGTVVVGANLIKHFLFRRHRQASSARAHFRSREIKVQNAIKSLAKTRDKMKTLETKLENYMVNPDRNMDAIQQVRKEIKKQEKLIKKYSEFISRELEGRTIGKNGILKKIATGLRFVTGKLPLVYYQQQHDKYFDILQNKSNNKKYTDMRVDGNVYQEMIYWHQLRRDIKNDLSERYANAERYALEASKKGAAKVAQWFKDTQVDVTKLRQDISEVDPCPIELGALTKGMSVGGTRFDISTMKKLGNYDITTLQTSHRHDDNDPKSQDDYNGRDAVIFEERKRSKKARKSIVIGNAATAQMAQQHGTIGMAPITTQTTPQQTPQQGKDDGGMSR